MPPTTPSRGGPGASRGRPGHAVPTTVGKGKGGGKLSGKTILSAKRHRKILKDQIQSITKPDIRRLARRGGVKRISAPCYNETRHALKQRLEAILKLVVTYVEYRKMKTVTVGHVIFSLRQLGTPIYGFDPNTYTERRSKAARDRQAGGD